MGEKFGGLGIVSNKTNKLNMMNEECVNKVDLSIPRRKYNSKDCGLTFCPECGLPLIKNNCSVIITIKSDTDECDLISNLTGSHFCNSCPVVVFDSDKTDHAVKLGAKGDQKNLRYLITGIVNFDDVPEEKRHVELGIEDNPIPLVQFLPGLKRTSPVIKKKSGRNEPCPCGSGIKYKKCCGLNNSSNK